MAWKSARVLVLCGAVTALAADVERGVALYKQRDYNGAVAELQAAVDADGADRRARYYLALTQIELQRYSDADTHLKQLESSEGTPPEPAELKVALARGAMGQKDLDRAQQYLDQAREADSGNAEVYLRRGELALQRKQYETAASELEHSIELDANRPYAHYFLGIAYSNLKKPDQMIEQFEIFRKLAPNAPEVSKIESALRSVRR
jgi:tetratricopeptide (TPR) repeat protein